MSISLFVLERKVSERMIWNVLLCRFLRIDRQLSWRWKWKAGALILEEIWDNLGHVPVAVFCCFCISEKFLKKYSRNGLKIHGDQFLPGTKTKTEEDPEGCSGAPRGVPGAAPP